MADRHPEQSPARITTAPQPEEHTMSHSHRGRRIAATAAAASLALAGAVAVVTPAVAAPPSDVDYFADTIPGLRAGSVFESVTYERFERLLNSDGTFAFLIGGPDDATVAAAAAHIDAVAQEYDVDAIYTFNPALAGDDVDIRTSEIEKVAALWTNLADNYLNKDTTPGFTGGADDPYLFVYDKAHTAGDAEDRIVASLSAGVSASASADAYREQVAAVFDAAAGDFATQSQFEFFSGAVNQRHTAQYAEAEFFGGEIFTPADAEGFVLQSITYPELIHLLESDGDHTILFGGTWCHNTRAVIHEVNSKAVQAGVETVYVFDLRLDGLSGPPLHVRDTGSELAYLYGDLANGYFDNLRTQYVTNGSAGQRVEYYPGGDTTSSLEIAQKLQVPYLIEYSADAAAPIVKDWIRDNGDGTFSEFMTEYWWIADLPGKRSARYTTDEAWAAEQAKQWDFADQALAALDVFFGLDAEVPGDGDGSGEPTPTPTEPGTPSPSPSEPGSETPSPSPTTGLPETGGDDDAAEPAVTVSGALQPGGTIVVRGSGLAADSDAVRVELHSTPQVLGTASTDASGAFELTATIPASTAVGAHSVVVFVDGVEVARTSVTVGEVLAVTGFDAAVVGTAGIAAVLLILAGTGILVARRRATA